MYIDVPMPSLLFFRFLRHPNLRRSKKATPEIHVWLKYSKNCQSWRFMSVSCSHAGLGILPKNEPLISLRHLLTFSSEKTQIVGLGDFILWEAATPVFLWLGIPVQNINFLFDDLTNQMRRDTWKKKKETNGNSPSFPIISGAQCFSCVDHLVCH